MAKKTKKEKFSCYHAHDYSTIELNGETFLEITNLEPMEDDKEGMKEYNEIPKRVEYVVELLNKNIGKK